MATPVIRYEEDRTGRNPNNLVAGEAHTLQPRQRRILVPMHGPFYTESLVIIDVATGRQLSSNDYHCADFVQTAQWLSGKEVAATIVIKNRSISNNVTVNYQSYGGFYNVNASVLKAQIEALNLDNRPVIFDKIIGKPAGFAPAEHMHDVGDVYGWEYVVFALERIRAAIEMGDEGSHDVIYKYIDQALQQTSVNVTRAIQESDTHTARTDNPHRVTAEQVGTYTKAVIDNLLNNLRTTLSTATTQHANLRNNPHGVTAAQVGAHTKSEVTGLLSALETKITGLINTHANKRDNPHGVTAAQVGTMTTAQINNAIGTAKRELNDAITVMRDTINRTILNNGKINRAVFPISTTAGNQLNWHGDGIYLNNTPRGLSADTGNRVYLDDNTNHEAGSTALENALNEGRTVVGHTHHLARASYAAPGIVQLYGGADSDSHTMALSAQVGKHLNDQIIATRNMVFEHKFNHTVANWAPPGDTSGYAENHVWFQFL